MRRARMNPPLTRSGGWPRPIYAALGAVLGALVVGVVSRHRDTVRDSRHYNPDYKLATRWRVDDNPRFDIMGRVADAPRRGDTMATHRFTALVHSEGNCYVARCAEMSVVSQGNSVAEAVGNLRNATHLYLKVAPRRTINQTEIVPYEVTDESPAEESVAASVSA